MRQNCLTFYHYQHPHSVNLDGLFPCAHFPHFAWCTASPFISMLPPHSPERLYRLPFAAVYLCGTKPVPSCPHTLPFAPAMWDLRILPHRPFSDHTRWQRARILQVLRLGSYFVQTTAAPLRRAGDCTHYLFAFFIWLW